MITETDRLAILAIRTLTFADKNSLFEIYSDKEAMKYRGSKPFTSLDDVEKMLMTTFQKLASQEEFRYAVIQKEHNELIGTFLIRPTSHHECDIGYSIGKKYWQKGYGTELLQGMLNYIDSLAYTKILASSHKENIASLKLLESSGFTLLAEKEVDNCYCEYVCIT